MGRDRHHKENEHARRRLSQPDLDALRRTLETGEIPAGLDLLYQQLGAGTPENHEATGEEDAMLALLISEALDGVDVARRYPRFFQRLLANMALRDAFLDGVAALENGGDGAAADALPFAASRDLSFLEKVRQTPAEKTATDAVGWTVNWRRAGREIAALFSFLALEPDPSLRSDSGFLEDETVTLLRGKLSSKNVELDLTLEATRPASQPDELQLSLWVVAADEATERAKDLALLATVRWGSYEAQLDITADGRYTLPPRKLEDVIRDAEESSVELNVTLHEKR